MVSFMCGISTVRTPAARASAQSGPPGTAATHTS